MSSITGCMMKNVRNSASPISTEFGGFVCVASAERTNESTTMMRVNEVIMTSKVGAKVRIVSSSRICSERTTSDGLVAGVMPMLTRGIGTVGGIGPGIVAVACANAGIAATTTTASAKQAAAGHSSERRVMTS